MTKKRHFALRTPNMKKARGSEDGMGRKIYDLPEDVLVWMMKFLSLFDLRVLSRAHPKFTRVVSLRRFFLVRSLASLEKACRFNVEKVAYRGLQGFSPKPSRFARFKGCVNVLPVASFWETVRYLEIDSPTIFSSMGHPNLRLLTIYSEKRSTLVLGASFEKLLDGRVKEISISTKGIVFFPVSALKKMEDSGTTIFRLEAESGFFYSPSLKGGVDGGMCLHPVSSLDFGTVNFFSSGVRDPLFSDAHA